MRRLNQRFIPALVQILDQVILLAALLTAAAAVHHELEDLSFSGFLSLRLEIRNILIVLGLMGLWHGLLSAKHLYQLRTFSPWQRDARDVVPATTILTLVFLLLSWLIDISFAKPLFFLLFWLILTLASQLLRLGWRLWWELVRRQGLQLTQALIVGTNSRAVALAQAIQDKPELGYRIIGFVDDDWFGLQKFRASGYPLVSDLKNFPQYLREHVVDEVIIELPLNTSYQQVAAIVNHCLQQGILVRLVSDSFYLLRNLRWGRSTIEEFNDTIIISVSNGLLGGVPLVAKRLVDICGSLALLVLFSPLMVVVALLIKLTSPGPVFFVQERLGLNKRPFRMYKFRTMVADAEQQQAALAHLNEMQGPTFKIKNDPRITPLGAILRRTSIDELPQLINVLQGEMSLVGPRPLPVRDYQGFREDWHRRRFSVKPGLTCLWQVQGRNTLPFKEWMKLDLQYIDNWSFWLDIRILLRTIPAVWQKKGAY
ncbi:MAG: sugar transferase [Desulfobacca sp.]|uniref:sugar transferase n=1 Tax=Desulfobacca sp. TaxID=2067990 RepID=UPI0040496829